MLFGIIAIHSKPMHTHQITLVSHQHWKLQSAFASVLLSGSLMWFDRPIADLLGVSHYAPTLVGTLLSIATLVLAAVAVRCPSCGISLVWFALSRKSTGAWLGWLLEETTCPVCGYAANDANGVKKTDPGSN